jgi:hypothetical protein
MGLVEDLVRTLLAPKLEELRRELESGNYRNAAWVIEAARAEYPHAAEAIAAAFTGTPEEALENVRVYAPWVDEIPNAVGVVGLLQAEMIRQWNKPRRELAGWQKNNNSSRP